LLRTLAPYLAFGYISLVGWTSRLRWSGLEHLRQAGQKSKRGFIYAFWHQRQVMFTYTHRQVGVNVLVSRSRDGGIIAEVMRLFGIPAVRGSSSRGSMSATRELVSLLEKGDVVGITPDGPKGPAREVKPGVLYLAQQSGCPILPITNASSRRLVLQKAWDRFNVPLPFSRIFVSHGRPVWISPEDDLRAKAAELKAELDRITEEADRLAA